jgi:hypothetical protein
MCMSVAFDNQFITPWLSSDMYAYPTKDIFISDVSFCISNYCSLIGMK